VLDLLILRTGWLLEADAADRGASGAAITRLLSASARI
jgi:hypothetical protein